MMSIDRSIIEQIVRRVLEEYQDSIRTKGMVSFDLSKETKIASDTIDITSIDSRMKILVDQPINMEALRRMKENTTARVGVGCCGSRLKTMTMLQLRADHAAARDAVFNDVDKQMIERLQMLFLQSKCVDKEQFLTRPDLGRLLSPESVEQLRKEHISRPDVQIVVCDGLSSTAVATNVADFLPVLLDNLRVIPLAVGKPVFVRFGRVGVGDHIAEITGAKVVCVLLGERPGLATAESMSAYITYNARIGIIESCRTVVSNIHRNGIPAVEAGAYVSDLIKAIIEAKKSGIDFRK